MRYRYIAYNLNQGLVKGKLDARTPQDAYTEVRERGLKVLTVEPDKGLPTLESLFPSFFRVKTGDLVRFARNTASIIRSGGSLLRALEMLQEETHSRVMRQVLEDIRRTLDEGGSLSEAMREHSDAFSAIFVSVVEVGEYSGQLAPSLEQLAEVLEREQEAKRKALNALMYPVAIVLLSLVTMGVLMMVALPPMLQVFKQMGSEVPLVTRLTVGAFTWVKAHFFRMIVGAILLAGAIKLLRGIPQAKYWMDSAQLKLPVLGGIVMASEISQFSRTMAMLLEAGVSLATALRLAISGCKNQVIKSTFANAEESLLGGRGFTSNMKNSQVLPSLFLELSMIGEMSNTLKKTMKDAAETYEKQLQQRLNGLLSLIEPLSTIMVGGIVALMALSMLLPVYAGLKSFK